MLFTGTNHKLGKYCLYSASKNKIRLLCFYWIVLRTFHLWKVSWIINTSNKQIVIFSLSIFYLWLIGLMRKCQRCYSCLRGGPGYKVTRVDVTESSDSVEVKTPSRSTWRNKNWDHGMYTFRGRGCRIPIILKIENQKMKFPRPKLLFKFDLVD